METKVCTRCQREKPLSEFYKAAKGKFGVRAKCKPCVCFEANHGKGAHERKTKWSKEHRKEANEARRKHYHADIEASRKFNREKRRRLRRERPSHYRKTGARYNLARYYRLKNTPEFKLRKTLRSRFARAIIQQFKRISSLDLLGCTIVEARRYIEKLFKPGMTWENHGIHGWHIDHIRPCDSFDLTKLDEQKKCFHFTNLQPLWASENLSKSNRETEKAGEACAPPALVAPVISKEVR